MHHTHQLSPAPSAPAVADHHDDVASTTYTAPCRRCGRRLHLSEDEMLASLTSPPACWHCAGRDRGHQAT